MELTGFEFILKYLEGTILIGALVAFFVLEQIAPVIESRSLSWRHTLGNLKVGLIYIALGVLVGTFLTWLAAYTNQKHWGLYNLVDIPGKLWSKIILGIIIIDFVEYWKHRWSHTVGWIWRIHRLHHTDPVMDVSTTLRNHPLNWITVIVPRALLIPLLGIGPLTLALYTSIALSVQYFHHSNVRVPLWLERILSKIIVTPDLHFVHHATEERLTNSQYAITFIIWDRLFGTLAPLPERKSLRLGLDGFEDNAEQSFVGMMASPLDKGARMRWAS